VVIYHHKIHLSRYILFLDYCILLFLSIQNLTDMSAPTAKPSAASAEPSKPQTPRYVPGADGLASKKPKKKKANTSGHAAPTSTVNGDTPVALLSKAPSASELPAELLAEKGEIERELKEDAAAAAASGGHEKGPIGEAVSRRMKVLTKKIVSVLCDTSFRKSTADRQN
jgi:hypothetical protein